MVQFNYLLILYLFILPMNLLYVYYGTYIDFQWVYNKVESFQVVTKINSTEKAPSSAYNSLY